MSTRSVHKPSKSWTLTLNNWTAEEWDLLTEEMKDLYARATFGKEHQPENRPEDLPAEEEWTPHIQGAVTLKKAVRLSWWKKRVPRAHVEVMRARSQQGQAAFDYCEKEGDFVKIDNRERTKEASSKQKALEEWTEAFKDGDTLQTLIENDPINAAKYAKSLEWLALHLTKPRTEKPTVVWLYGPSGAGKSWRVMQEVGPQAYWHKCDSFKWWSLYQGHREVVLEEFRGGHESLNGLLRLFDFTPLAVETKGGHMQMTSRTIYVTTPYSPVDVYRNVAHERDEAIGQLRRRVDEVYYCYVDWTGAYCCEDKTEELKCGRYFEVERAPPPLPKDFDPEDLYKGDYSWAAPSFPE